MGEIQEIDVYVQPDGNVKIEVRGVKGKKCLDITREIEEQLGGQILQREETHEMHEAEQQRTQDEEAWQEGW
jgi:hypothetical protein